MRIIVCGSREWNNFKAMNFELVALYASTDFKNITIVHGDCHGADKMAGAIAQRLGMTVEPHPADWAGRGKIAGPERNRLMASLGADLVLAFKDDFDPEMKRGGTENMVKLAIEAGIPVRVFSNGARYDR